MDTVTDPAVLSTQGPALSDPGTVGLEDWPLNPAIGEALRLWHGSAPDSRFVVLRGYEELPVRCGFDLDVIVDPTHVGSAVEAAVAVGQEAGLLAYAHRKSERSAKVAWFVPAIDPAHRQWLLIDIGSRVVFGTHRVAWDGIETETWTNGEFELKVPNADWRATFQGLRNLAGSENQHAAEHPLRPEDMPKLADVVGNENAATFVAALELPAPGDRRSALRAWCRNQGFREPTPRPRGDSTPTRARLSRLIFFRLPFWERHRPRFIVVTGPDGVGKTTLISHLLELLNQYPMDFDSLHHLGATKATGWSEGSAKGSSNPEAHRPADNA